MKVSTTKCFEDKLMSWFSENEGEEGWVDVIEERREWCCLTVVSSAWGPCRVIEGPSGMITSADRTGLVQLIRLSSDLPQFLVIKIMTPHFSDIISWPDTHHTPILHRRGRRYSWSPGPMLQRTERREDILHYRRMSQYWKKTHYALLFSFIQNI